MIILYAFFSSDYTIYDRNFCLQKPKVFIGKNKFIIGSFYFLIQKLYTKNIKNHNNIKCEKSDNPALGFIVLFGLKIRNNIYTF